MPDEAELIRKAQELVGKITPDARQIFAGLWVAETIKETAAKILQASTDKTPGKR